MLSFDFCLVLDGTQDDNKNKVRFTRVMVVSCW